MTLTTERIILNEERNVTLTVMVQTVKIEFRDVTKRPAVLILPGGGYKRCSDREAEVIAYPYLNAGYHAFVLRYSVNEHKAWPNPLNDYEQAMELIRGKGEEWNILTDKIAVIGFSAGGHLAATAATIAKNRPDAAILVYAATERDIALACQPGTDIPGPTECVDENTPPCFICATRDDKIVPVHNSLNFQLALAKYGVPFESHIYSYGGHGFATGLANITNNNISSRVPNWMADSIGWLDEMFGQLTYEGIGEPKLSSKAHKEDKYWYEDL